MALSMFITEAHGVEVHDYLLVNLQRYRVTEVVPAPEHTISRTLKTQDASGKLVNFVYGNYEMVTVVRNHEESESRRSAERKDRLSNARRKLR